MDNLGLSVFHLNLNVKYRITSDMKNSEFLFCQRSLSVLIFCLHNTLYSYTFQLSLSFDDNIS